MLGNQIELWESTLALVKLGAVVMPTTSALGRSDLADRIARGKARAVIANAAEHAWSCLFAPWIAEATVFVYNYRRLDAVALLSQLRRAGVTTFCAPSTLWRMLIQTDLGVRPGRLREIVAAGEPLNPDVIAQVERAWGLTIRDGYGQTETTLLVGNLPGRRLAGECRHGEGDHGVRTRSRRATPEGATCRVL
jgi:acyl-coenzyme A synthetase/AMP-(fatty) acid ligase